MTIRYSRIINIKQYDVFITLLRSEVDRLNDIIQNESTKLTILSSQQELDEFIKERDKLSSMIYDLNGEQP